MFLYYLYIKRLMFLYYLYIKRFSFFKLLSYNILLLFFTRISTIHFGMPVCSRFFLSVDLNASYRILYNE